MVTLIVPPQTITLCTPIVYTTCLYNLSFKNNVVNIYVHSDEAADKVKTNLRTDQFANLCYSINFFSLACGKKAQLKLLLDSS
jgi:hypothetical protein